MEGLLILLRETKEQFVGDVSGSGEPCKPGAHRITLQRLYFEEQKLYKDVKRIMQSSGATKRREEAANRRCDPRAIQRTNCYHNEGLAAACEYGSTYSMLIFGIIQVILSQIPDFNNTEWLSVLAATMSFVYSIIGSALGLANVIGMTTGKVAAT
ncbi:hypothetical protein ACS0TY_025695 [Phlomoides rotata]